MSRIIGFLKWCSLLVIAPLTFIGLFVVFGLDELIAWATHSKSTYEQILEEHDRGHEEENWDMIVPFKEGDI